MRLLVVVLAAALLVACEEAAPVERIVKVYDNGNPERAVLYDASETLIIGEKYFYDDGTLRIEGPLKEGVRNGTWYSYTMKGNLLSVNNYAMGVYQGDYENYYPDGGLRIQGQYIDGKEVGEWIVFNEAGQRHGLFRRFDDEGVLREKGRYEQGNKLGFWETFNANGVRTDAVDHGSGDGASPE